MANVLFDIDVWQTLMDFETGELVETADSELMNKIMKITPKLPYPGDNECDSLGWTIDAALAVNELYNPDVMFVSMATPMLMRTNLAMTEEENITLVKRTFFELRRFFENTDFEPVVVGGGGMTKVLGEPDFSALSCKPTYSSCTYNYGGMFNITKEDAEKLADVPHIQKIIPKEQYIKTNPHINDTNINLMPDYLVMREDGYSFVSITKRGMQLKMIPRIETEIPVYTTLGVPRHILDIRPMIEKALDDGKKVALVVVEGIGEEEFELPFEKVSCVSDWFGYDQGIGLYLALSTGKSYAEQDYPPVVSVQTYLNTSERYPYSQYFSKLPTDTVFRRKDKKTAAVGTRSGFTHETTVADICFECHSRNLSESGIMVLVNDEK